MPQRLGQISSEHATASDFLSCRIDEVRELFLSGPRRSDAALPRARRAACKRRCRQHRQDVRFQSAGGKARVPQVRLHLSPFKIRSLVSPPWPLRQRAQGPLGAAFLKHTLPQLLEKADRDPRLVAYVNGRRLELVGFPLAREREPLDAALCRFLQGQGKPLVFTTRGPPDEQGRRAEQDEVREQLATFRPISSSFARASCVGTLGTVSCRR